MRTTLGVGLSVCTQDLHTLLLLSKFRDLLPLGSNSYMPTGAKKQKQKNNSHVNPTMRMYFNITLTFMHLADAFIQSDLQLHSGYSFLISMCFPWESNPQPFALLTQCSTTEPHRKTSGIIKIVVHLSLSTSKIVFTAISLV